MKNTKLLILLSMILGIVSACDNSTGSDEMNELQLSFSGLEPLQNGFHYEGWALIGGEPRTTGKFNVNDSGEPVDLSGNPIPNAVFTVDYDLSATSTVVITIEPAGDTDEIPAATHILAGDVTGEIAMMSADHGGALGVDFGTVAGNYILATPTNGDGTNENSGIWFLDLSGGSSAVGLDLPQLPDGWNYEGWAVYDGTPLTSGTFTAVDEVDDAAPFSGPGNGPPFPGEDYLENAPDGVSFPIDLAGGTAVISVEPDPDDSPAPFTLKPLAGGIPSGATDHTTYALDNNIGSIPTGIATIR